MEYTDRYQALGMPYPELATMCRGQCEGTGWVPVCGPHALGAMMIRRGQVDRDRRLEDAWIAAHALEHPEPCDGWHFVQCPDCKGTGKRDG